MMTASIRLAGARSYYLVADFGSSERGRASIIPLSMDAPMPAEAGWDEGASEEAALNAAAEAARTLPGNRGLEMRVV